MSAINATSSPDRAVVDPSSSRFCPVSMFSVTTPSDVAARPIQAGNESGFDRVGAAINTTGVVVVGSQQVIRGGGSPQAVGGFLVYSPT